MEYGILLEVCHINYIHIQFYSVPGLDQEDQSVDVVIAEIQSPKRQTPRQKRASVARAQKRYCGCFRILLRYNYCIQ
jgi:hypothetical protein